MDHLRSGGAKETVIYELGEHRVQTVGDEFFVAPGAAVIGRVFLGRDVSVWFGAVLRADGNVIRVGDRSNVQDNAVLHVDSDAPVTVGHEPRGRVRKVVRGHNSDAGLPHPLVPRRREVRHADDRRTGAGERLSLVFHLTAGRPPARVAACFATYT